MASRKQSTTTGQTKTIKVPDYPRTALLLQGGGALGSYQAGVIEGLEEAGIHANWVAGISIGALNACIFAGNPPAHRVDRLKKFWQTICQPPSVAASAMRTSFDLLGEAAQPWRELTQGFTDRLFGSYAATRAMMEGQKGFFSPRHMAPGMGTPATTSYYDTKPVIATLESLVDFDRINSGETRVSVGAVNVRTGNFIYFDNTEMKLRPEHFLASGSLPPGFPAVEIDGEFYWDGGCVSNTPLDYIFNQRPRKDTLIFQVDLWSAVGEVPTNVLQIAERMKDIQYSSKTRGITNSVKELQELRKKLWETIDRIPASVRAKDPWFDELAAHLFGVRYNCIHLIYKNKPIEGHYKDYEFSHETMRLHWDTGLTDMRRTLEHPGCLDYPPPGENFVTFDVHRHD